MKYFTSDLHFNHKSIVDFCPKRVKQLGLDLNLYEQYLSSKKVYLKDEYKCPIISRIYETNRDLLIQNHNKRLIEIINKYVQKRDILYILGDFGFGNTVDLKKILAKLNGQKILILGNHDRDAKVMLEMGFHAVYENHKIKIGTEGQKVLLSHFPYFPTGYRRFKHWLSYRKAPDKRYLHKRIYDTGDVLFHGHTHDAEVQMKYNKRQIHIGIDAWGRPVSEEELVKIIKKL